MSPVRKEYVLRYSCALMTSTLLGVLAAYLSSLRLMLLVHPASLVIGAMIGAAMTGLLATTIKRGYVTILCISLTTLVASYLIGLIGALPLSIAGPPAAFIAANVVCRLIMPMPKAFAPTCDYCGYSIANLSSDRCPECGTEVAASTRRT